MIDLNAHYAAMHGKGLAQIAAGTLTVFPGIDDSLKKRFVVASMFRLSLTLQTLFRKLLDSKGFSLGFITAGSEFPAHVTLKQASIPKGVSHPSLCIYPEEIDGMLSVEFDTLILDGCNLILAASVVPEKIVSLRKRLDGEMSDQGLEPSPLPILHSTLLRIVRLPISPAQALAKYQEFVTAWRAEIKENPLTLDLSTVKQSTTYDLLSGS